ncbi:sialidase family protein [Glycomyces xiaoerkulensis]|uniref:sialidase family protein n=1 Tax=Glycomyces xiaoerkulensis TaxID=2038139 RepID=UPI000C26539D|nr:sialidase family protein [Glycomyces xiaoerkulensis]
MAADEYSRFTRRTVLTGAAAVLAAGVTAAPPRAAAAAAPTALRAATVRDGRVLALTADEAGHYAIRPVEADAGRRVELGPPLEVSLPERFHPHSIAAVGGTLWITGAVDAGRHRALPGLFRVETDRAEAVALPVPDPIRSGAATSIAPLGAEALAVAVEGGPDPHAALIARSHLALSADGGLTWTDRPLAADLGEGYGTVLAGHDGRLYAVAADGAGDQTVYSGLIDAEIEPVAAEPGAGRPMAAVATGGDQVAVFSDRDGSVHGARYGRDGRRPESAGHGGGRTGEVVAVQGRPNAWLETEDDRVSARGLG